ERIGVEITEFLVLLFLIPHADSLQKRASFLVLVRVAANFLKVSRGGKSFLFSVCAMAAEFGLGGLEIETIPNHYQAEYVPSGIALVAFKPLFFRIYVEMSAGIITSWEGTNPQKHFPLALQFYPACAHI